jgi:hypothetical protein
LAATGGAAPPRERQRPFTTATGDQLDIEVPSPRHFHYPIQEIRIARQDRETTTIS